MPLACASPIGIGDPPEPLFATSLRATPIVGPLTVHEVVVSAVDSELVPPGWLVPEPTKNPADALIKATIIATAKTAWLLKPPLEARGLLIVPRFRTRRRHGQLTGAALIPSKAAGLARPNDSAGLELEPESNPVGARASRWKPQ